MKTHFTPDYIKNPNHPISINLIGCGGTGSRVLAELAAINYNLIELGKPGIDVITYDPDTVSRTNIGRQKFFPIDIGQNKASLLTSRINMSYHLNWLAKPYLYEQDQEGQINTANITIICVDSLKARKNIYNSLLHGEYKSRYMNQYEPFYVLDFGNKADIGQIILSTVKKIEQPDIQLETIETIDSLPTIFERFPELNEKQIIEESSNTPSCSTAQALREQNLFINSSLIPFGMDLLWNLINEGQTNVAGAFVNLANYKTNPLYL